MTIQLPPPVPTMEYLSTNLAEAQVELRQAVVNVERMRSLRSRRQGPGWGDLQLARMVHRRLEQERDRWLNALTAHALEHAHIGEDCPGCEAR